MKDSATQDEDESWIERRIKQPLEDLNQRYFIEFILRRKPLPNSRDGRHIPLRTLGHSYALLDERRGAGGAPYISNSIRSARYTIWSFFPSQIWFQATRIHNFYFLCIGVPQTIPGISTTGSYTTILPLLFFLVLTILKEGYDDICRHRGDRVENAQGATVLRERGLGGVRGRLWVEEVGKYVRGRLRVWGMREDRGEHTRVPGKEEGKELDVDEELLWTSIRWMDIKVGDVIKLKRDDAIPADIVLLSTSGENGVAYVETMALDGETNLKSRQAPHALRTCQNIAGIKACQARFVSEDPNRKLYEYNGRVTVDGQMIPLTLNEVALRGCVLRNVATAIGVVINTGEETKIRMNANHHPKAKKPRLESYANQVVLFLVFYVVMLAVGSSIGYLLWHSSTEVDSWYLNNAYVPFKNVLVGDLIAYNNIIPLALWISLEIVKIAQMIMLHSDVGMFDEESNTPMSCNTNTILENLGQVSYVLSDKTGTLTENVMRFRKISVAGIAWSHGGDEEARGRPSLGGGRSFSQVGSGLVEDAKAEKPDEKEKLGFSVENRELSHAGSERRLQPNLLQRLSSDRRSNTPLQSADSNLTTHDLLQHIRLHPGSAFSRKAREFILGLALCHMALPETRSDGHIDFQASSPDEIALVQAAQDLGFLLIQRSTQSITLRETDCTGRQIQHVYEILDVIEFSSKRKRMSIIVRCPDGKIWLVCKGADSAIMPRLKQSALASRKSHEVRRSIQVERDHHRRSEQIEPRNSFGARPSLTIRRKSSMDIRPDGKKPTLEIPKSSYEMRGQTRSLVISRRPDLAFLNDPAIADDSVVFTRCFRQLDEFANEGLRTLIFAHKSIPENEYAGWKKLYADATTSLVDRQARVEAVGEMIESGFDLLGASAIEDKLQKGVPETIDKLRRANIKIWMLTGDKRETAINIAHSARICKPESELYTLDASKGDIEEQLRSTALDLKNGCLHSVAVIDGHTLAAVDRVPALKHLFYALIPLLGSVICCRASPAQKASIVKAIRTRVPGALTLAIGDGGNDIAMIQAAHVGVGISGKEGLQAARVADFSIAQFRFLQRLLLVHGRWSYVRTAKFVLWTFWKESFFYTMQVLFQRYNGFTGTSLYESTSLTVLNTLFTSLCVIVPGIFEQDLRAETLLAVPELYVHGQRNLGLNLPKYLVWMVLATAQGLVVWFVAWVSYGVFNPMGDNGLYALGDLAFSLGIMWTNWKLLIIETHYKTLVVGISALITISGWWAWNAFLSVIGSSLSPYDVKNGFTQTFGKDPIWWLTLLLALAILALVDLAYQALCRQVVLVGRWRMWKRGREQSAEEWDLEIWQRLERDAEVREILRRRAGGEAEGELEIGVSDEVLLGGVRL